MGHAAFQQHAVARDMFARADEALGFSISALCFEGSLAELTDTAIQQPALYTVGMAHWAVLVSAETQPPAFHAGQSLGEITALAAAGYLTFEDGLYLAQQRGQLMKASGEQTTGAMTAVLGLEIAQVKACCRAIRNEYGLIVSVANDNSAVQQIIAGETYAIELTEIRLRAAGAKKLVRLPISIASHCALMRSVSADFGRILNGVDFLEGSIPVMGNVSASTIPAAPAAIRSELSRQLTSPVRWRESMINLVATGVTTFIEVGPGDTLTRLMKRIDRNVTRHTFQP